MDFHPDDYAETPLGQLLIADGLNPVKIWDGLQAAPVDAGLDAPGTAVTLALPGSPAKGAIYGDYQAYVRFLDAEGNPSNLSPVSNTLTARTGPVSLTDATNTKPIRITKSLHGLSTGNIVEISGVEGNEAANAVWKVTVLDANTFSLDTSDGDGDYTTGGIYYAGVTQINYTSVPVPTASKAVRKQILRNTDGQLTTFYVDVDTTNVAATTANSTLDDDTLSAREAVPLLNQDGQIFADANEKPPDFLTCPAHHLGRMFLTVNKVYDQGAVAVTNGSPTVTGIGTAWTAVMAGRFFYARGATQAYEIDSVNVANQTLTLLTNYADATVAYTSYAIKPPPAQRRLVYYSRAGYPQSFSATYALELQDNGDELSGIMTKGPFVYFLEKSHISKLTFQTDPAVDGHVFPAVERGCINNRCWVQVEDKAYMLDSRGVHAFAGGEDTEPVSTPIQPIFSGDSQFYAVNWKASDLFHACYSPDEEAVRFFVSLGSCVQPRHALVFHTRFQRWSLEEYQQPVLCSTLGWQRGRRAVFVGSEAKRVVVLFRGNLDGIDAGGGTLAGNATGAGPCSLEDSHASFPASAVGLSVGIIKGKGFGQQRAIHSVTATELGLIQPWLVRPDRTSVYQIAGVKWRFVTKMFDWSETDREQKRRIGINIIPADNTPAYFALQYYEDTRLVPKNQVTTTDGQQYEAAGGVAGKPYYAIDATRKDGYAQQRLEGHRDLNYSGPRRYVFELLGIAGQDGWAAEKMVVDGSES